MKILFIVDSFSGGAGNVVQILATGLTKRGYKVSILWLSKYGESKYDLCGVEVFERPLNKYASGICPIDRVYNAVKLLRAEFDKIKPDVIVSFLTEFNILSCLANKKLPLIISERNDPDKQELKSYWRFLREISYKKADSIIVQSPAFSKFANNRYYNLTSVIPNPILHPAIMKESSELHNPIRLVSLGRLSPQKNFRWMIDRMVELRKYIDNFVLDIYGSGPLEEEMKQYILEKKMDNHVFLKGYVNNTYEVLADHDIYLMTSDYEGFPNALSEAMAVGLPSISRKCHEGMSDLVINNQNGILVDMEDTKGFVQSLLKVIYDSQYRNKTSEEAKRVSDTYNSERILDLWEDAINQLSKR